MFSVIYIYKNKSAFVRPSITFEPEVRFELGFFFLVCLGPLITTTKKTFENSGNFEN